MNQLLRWLLLCLAILTFINVTVTGQNRDLSEQDLLKRANDYLEVREYEKAIENYSNAILKNPVSKPAYKGRGICYYKLKNSQEALRDLEQFYKWDSSDVLVNVTLGRIYGQGRNYSEAVRVLERNEKLRRVPDEYRLLLWYYGILNGKAKEVNLTMSTSSNASKYGPNVIFMYLQGLALDSLGNSSSADNKFSGSCNLLMSLSKTQYNEKYDLLMDLFSYEFHFRNRADRLFHAGDYKSGVIDLYEKILETEPFDAVVNYRLAFCFFKTEKYDEARNYFLKSKDIDHTNPDLYYYLGYIDMQNDQWTQARNYFITAIKMNCRHPRLYIYAAKCAFKDNNFKEAHDYCKIADTIPRDPELPGYIYKEHDTYCDKAAHTVWINNKESEKPVFNLESPVAGKNYRMGFKRNKPRKIQFTIKDKSPIKQVVVNDSILYCDTTKLNPQFHFEFHKSVETATIRFSDVYGNGDSVNYHLYGLDNIQIELYQPALNFHKEIVPENPDADSIQVSGKILSESPVLAIRFNNTHLADVDSLIINPPFNVELPFDRNARTLAMTVIETDRTETEITFPINYEEAIAVKNNQMGKTWFVFIENSVYDEENSLTGPGKDFRNISKALKQYKIDEVIHRKNLNLQGFRQFIEDTLVPKVERNNVKSLIIWYAGHGVSRGNSSFWIPVDGNRNLTSSLYNTSSLIPALRSMSLNHVLVVTDACQAGQSIRIMRGDEEEKICTERHYTSKSAQWLTSSSMENVDDNSDFANYFAELLNAEPSNCVPIERIASRMKAKFRNTKQDPKFGKIEGLEHFDGTFFFIRK